MFRLTLKRKIIGLAVGASALSVLVLQGLMWSGKDSLSSQVKEEFGQMTSMNVSQIARDVVRLCAMVDEMGRQRVKQAMKVALDLLNAAGGVRVNGVTEEWAAVNQDTGQVVSVRLPRMWVKGQPLLAQQSFDTPVLLVDDILKYTGLSASVFQRMNEQGDMLRVASSLPDKDKKRVVGSYFPAAGADGKPSEIAKTVLAGKEYVGSATVLGDISVAHYYPLADETGRVFGMLGLGMKIQTMDTLRKSIMDIRVGKTGYVWVIGMKGKRRGSYVVSRNGQRDGESALNERDSAGRAFVQEILTKADSLSEGEVFAETYTWKNPDETAPRAKLTAVAVYRQWGWVIGASVYEDDYSALRDKVGDSFSTQLFLQSAGGALILAVAALVAFMLARRLADPLEGVTAVARKIASGEVGDAKKRLGPLLLKSGGGGRTLTALQRANLDETHVLIGAFQSMTDGLGSLIGQVQKSGIQVKTSSTAISASARQLEAMVSEHAGSTRQVMATSRQISEMSESLSTSMTTVAETVSGAATIAEAGRSELVRMETAMRQLVDSTSSISSKLSIIHDKAGNISGIVTTISKISDQTNLLSLNAAIEAEKAGDFGRGFSVVAREIRRLADQTVVATKDIEFTVRELQSSVASGVVEMDKFTAEVRNAVDEMGSIAEGMGAVIDEVRSLAPSFERVHGGMVAQVQSAQEIRDAVTHLSEAADQTRQALGDLKGVADQLDEAVKGLQKEVARFNLS